MTMRRYLPSPMLAAILPVVASLPAPAQPAPVHPFDPLSESEYRRVVRTIERSELVAEGVRYPLITLLEPRKKSLSNWKPGAPFDRRAFVVALDDGQVIEAVVDIGKRAIESSRTIPGAKPGILLTEDWTLARRLVSESEAWRAGLRRRGIDSSEGIVCVPLTVGYFGRKEERERRLAKVVCFDGRGTDNFWARPLEGLVAEVDLDRAEVLGVTDSGPRPIPPPPIDPDTVAAAASIEPPNIRLSQPDGPSFRLTGNVVHWQSWSFHVRVDPRLGLTVADVRYRVGERARSILYSGSLSELFVPYMSPDTGWYFRTYMDAGEYGIGKLASSLAPGTDCPSNALYLDAVFADDSGAPYTRQRAVCLFERYAGDIAWRHDESERNRLESRRRVDLVVRQISTVGNYDYVFDWTFRQDGTIGVSVGASGMEQVQVVDGLEADAAAPAYGRRVAPHTVAINHDHFFCFRLDLDVDGARNSFVADRLKRRMLDRKSPRRSVWVVDSSTAERERDAQMRINLERPALWRIVNPAVQGKNGVPVSYQLKPGTNAVSLLDPGDPPQRRAGFTDHHLWVTPYDEQERYAGGTYPNQNPGDDGLAVWTRANRKIRDTDVVVWYTLGFHHVVRQEDWPIMPTTRHGFELRPFDFFPYNPALNLP